MKPKLVIFDFDGVIINTEDILLKCLYKILQNYNINISFKELYRTSAGNDTLTALKNIVKDYKSNIKAEQIFHELLEKKDKCTSELLKMPYIEELIKSLKVPYCIASNSSIEHINETLKLVSLDKYFNNKNKFSAVSLGIFKPNPAVYLEALKTMNVKASDAIAIEDSVPGLTAAVAAKIPTIGLISSEHVDKEEHAKLLKQVGAFTTVTSLNEVKKLITQH